MDGWITPRSHFALISSECAIDKDDRSEPLNSTSLPTALLSEAGANCVIPRNVQHAQPGKTNCNNLEADGSARCAHIERMTVQVALEMMKQLNEEPEPFLLILSSFLPHVGSFSSSTTDPQVKAVEVLAHGCVELFGNNSSPFHNVSEGNIVMIYAISVKY
jgi:hypothetical protein